MTVREFVSSEVGMNENKYFNLSCIGVNRDINMSISFFIYLCLFYRQQE